jgi:hypothetical protein
VDKKEMVAMSIEPPEARGDAQMILKSPVAAGFPKCGEVLHEKVGRRVDFKVLVDGSARETEECCI